MLPGFAVPGRPPQPIVSRLATETIQSLHNLSLPAPNLSHQSSILHSGDSETQHQASDLNQIYGSAIQTTTLDPSKATTVPQPSAESAPPVTSSSSTNVSKCLQRCATALAMADKQFDNLVTSVRRISKPSRVSAPLPREADLLPAPWSPPFEDEDISMLPSIPQPAKPCVKPSSLRDTAYVLPGNQVFIDKVLPLSKVNFSHNERFPAQYFVALHKLVSSPGPSYSAYTPNFRGARIPLQHTRLNIPRWRHHLIGYDEPEICQFLEFGFPIGLSSDPPPVLVSTLRNHGSSTQYYPFMDEFLSTGLERCEVAGLFKAPPFTEVHVSPLMTAVKKPDSRRAVYDATFGDMSLNNNTPADMYLGQPFTYAYPRIEDFKRFVLKSGRGSFLWKRDLSRYYLQIPLCPTDYPLVCFVWRSLLFFFVALMFGLRHSGLQGQKVTTAVTWTHRRLGLDTSWEKMFQSLNYSDDIGGCEDSLEMATDSFNALGVLLVDLGLVESKSKAHPPSTSMPYLGIQFDTIAMRMSIPPEKVAEVRAEIASWVKKTTACKKSLQQLLGKLFWVSRCVKFSRAFMSQLLSQLKEMSYLPDHKKVKLSPECKQDILWWARYLRRFNGIEMMYPEDPLDLTLEQLLETSALVNCGDAQMMGGGAYFGNEYWSRPFPRWLQDPSVFIHLKEFYVVLVSAWLWGESWTGKLVYIFCDNDSVIEVLDKEKPKDPRMLELLKEFLYIVCTRKFTPVFKKIGTKANEVADFISRRHDPEATASFFKSKGLPPRDLIDAPDHLFKLHSNW